MNSFNQGSPQLLLAVRSGFAAQGTSFSQWCKQNGIARQNARMFVLGALNGPRSKEVRKIICSAAGVTVDTRHEMES